MERELAIRVTSAWKSCQGFCWCFLLCMVILQNVLFTLHVQIWPSGKLPFECQIWQFFGKKWQILTIFLKENVKFLAIFWHSNGNFSEGQVQIVSDVSDDSLRLNSNVTLLNTTGYGWFYAVMQEWLEWMVWQGKEEIVRLTSDKNAFHEQIWNLSYLHGTYIHILVMVCI